MSPSLHFHSICTEWNKFFFSLDCFFVSYCFDSIVFVFVSADIFRFHHKLFATRLNYRLQITKNKKTTYTHSQSILFFFLLLSFIWSVEKGTKNSFSFVFLTPHTLIFGDICYVSFEHFCMWLIIHIWLSILSINFGASCWCPYVSLSVCIQCRKIGRLIKNPFCLLYLNAILSIQWHFPIYLTMYCNSNVFWRESVTHIRGQLGCQSSNNSTAKINLLTINVQQYLHSKSV